jgi:hypothetical protein
MEEDTNSIYESSELDNLLEKCDKLINYSEVAATRYKFMQESMKSYEQAASLLGYFSQLNQFEEELKRLNDKLTIHRKKILSSYIDILSQANIKLLSIPSNKTKLYQIGVHKYYKVKNFILYDYKRKLYHELEQENKHIEKIRMIVDTVVRLDKHYDIYEELIGDMRKKNKTFSEIMRKHMSEYIYI